MKVHHTITPWRLGLVGDVGYSDAVAPCHIWTIKGPGHGLIATTAPWCQPGEQEAADAAFIVKAVNAYYKSIQLDDQASILDEAFNKTDYPPELAPVNIIGRKRFRHELIAKLIVTKSSMDQVEIEAFMKKCGL